MTASLADRAEQAAVDEEQVVAVDLREDPRASRCTAPGPASTATPCPSFFDSWRPTRLAEHIALGHLARGTFLDVASCDPGVAGHEVHAVTRDRQGLTVGSDRELVRRLAVLPDVPSRRAKYRRSPWTSARHARARGPGGGYLEVIEVQAHPGGLGVDGGGDPSRNQAPGERPRPCLSRERCRRRRSERRALRSLRRTAAASSCMVFGRTGTRLSEADTIIETLADQEHARHLEPVCCNSAAETGSAAVPAGPLHVHPGPVDTQRRVVLAQQGQRLRLVTGRW